MDIHKKGFYPYEFTAMTVQETTNITAPISSGDLIVDNIYTVVEAPTGGSPSFDGAVSTEAGTTFKATGTNAVWGTTTPGVVRDITTGVPTKVAFYNHTSVVFVWHYIYNTDGACVSYTVTDEIGQLI